MRLLQRFLIILLGAGIGLGGVEAYYFFTTPAPLKTYTLLFENGQSQEIQTQGFRVEGSCVTFYRADKQMHLCNFPVIIFERKVEPPLPAPDDPTQRSSSLTPPAGN